MSIEIDPDWFVDEAITEETRAFVARFVEQVSNLPPTHTIPPEVTRKARDDGRGVFPSAGPDDGSHWHEFENGRLRISPGIPGRGVYLHVHGGGWTLGRPAHYDRLNQAIAAKTGLTVASVEYRLAPEHPWPACLEDCRSAAVHLIGQKPFGEGPLFIGGESAGGHLAALLGLELRGMVAGLCLNYGIYDLDLTPSAAQWGSRSLVLSTPTIQWFVGNLAMNAEARRAASPLHADLAGLPAALFQVGTFDPLKDDTLMMAARWAGAGNETDLAVYPGGIHVLDAFDIEIAAQFHARQAAFLNRVLG
ncbi:alpha/beta hydrolase [Pontivivens nitratireducens]|uniref:Alpha/beta hydrolase n=1 Tax=Pontivivens nitratireducens TaxID=2758038 RepID=A0A6G7VL03_9RHOB|nr:alpha/beta hydrolase [Pontibrevibacter nitratireducens]QIK40684.1 alpha/beta hydrolase [Pontibrevibacter nitratireducens]